MTTPVDVRNDTTLGDLFAISPDELRPKLLQNIGGSEDWSKWSAPIRDAVVDEGCRKFAELMHVSLVDITSGALQKYAELLPYTDPSKYPPQDSVMKALDKKIIDSKHSPRIEVLLNDIPVIRLEFKVTLSLVFESLVLRIQNGRIMEVHSGQVHAEGNIKLGDATLIERKSSPIRFPGKINLGAGIEILR